MQFSDKVKYVRQKMLISQAELAKQIGVSFASVNRWENGIEPQFLTKAKFDKFCEENKILINDISENK